MSTTSIGEPTAGEPTGAAHLRHPRRWVILAVICLAQMTVLLDNTVLNVAIPSLNRELNATTADVQWMINAYSLVQSGLLLSAGSAADRYGRKAMLLVGLALFGAGSLVAGLAQGTGQLIAARAGMGIGGALLLTTTLAVVVQVFDEEERPKAIAMWGVVGALGFVAGPLIGGVILDHFWWGAIFLVNIPVALLGLVAVARLVPESRNPVGDRPDILGAVLSTIGMAGAVYAIISGPVHGWTSAPYVLLPAFAGVAALTGFVLWERRTPYPMLDMGFFRNRRFVGAVAGGILVMFGMGGSLFLLTQQLQSVLSYDPLEAGLRTAPMALTMVVVNMSGLGARFLLKFGTPIAMVTGMGLMAAGLVAVASLGGDGYGAMLLGLVVMGVGIGVASPAMANAIMSAIPPERAGVGAGVNGTLTEFGNGLGVAVLGAVLTAQFGWSSLPEAVRDTGPREAVRAFSSGLETSQLIGAVAVALGGLLAAVLLRRAENGSAEAQSQAH